MQSSEVRRRFLAFFEKRDHTVIPSAPLVPENDPSVLFNTAGMQPLVPYLLGQNHPAGKRLVNVQKCVRTQDIEEVGDKTHDTFFEMLGNWSLGDYFKEEAIKWSYELLTSKTEGFGLDPNRLYVTCFAGDENAPKDDESAKIWQKVDVPESRIYFLGAGDNWWPARKGNYTWSGPCGPDTEMFYDLTENGLGNLTHEQFVQACDEQKLVEIWNDVFMEYQAESGKITGKLKQKNVDTGAGLERLAMVLQKKDNIFDTDLFAPVMNKIDEFTNVDDVKARRIVADHIRTAVFLIADGVTPSNTDRGYVLRRLLRRAVRYADILKMKSGSLSWLAETVIEKYQDIYENLKNDSEKMKKEIENEEGKFRKTLHRGLKHLGMSPVLDEMRQLHDKKPSAQVMFGGKKIRINPADDLIGGDLTAEKVFRFFTTYGMPIDLIEDIADSYNLDYEEFYHEKLNILLEAHQQKSRAGAEKKFKGGLADANDEKVIQYHTATHLLHQALHDVLGENVMQKGSNITSERLRFDFAHAQKMTEEEKQKVEEIVNQKIKESLPVQNVVLPKQEAEKLGARMFFGDKYGEQVSVYFIGESLERAYSKEFCGGPHVQNTADLKGKFKIVKEEAISAGVRRIKAVLE